MSWRWFDCMTNTYHNIKDASDMNKDELNSKPLSKQGRRLMFKDNLELREKVFRKMGWKFFSGYDPAKPNPSLHSCWAKDSNYLLNLPPIETSWEVCAEYLVKWMREREWHYTIGFVGSHDLRPVFYWQGGKDQKWAMRSEIIQNDNLALAACEAYMEVEV